MYIPSFFLRIFSQVYRINASSPNLSLSTLQFTTINRQGFCFQGWEKQLSSFFITESFHLSRHLSKLPFIFLLGNIFISIRYPLYSTFNKFQVVELPGEENPSRIIVLLKTPGTTILPLKHRFLPWSIPVQNGFCRPFFLRAAKMFSALLIADTFLDHIR